MRVAYINGGVSISETFILDLANGLNEKVDLTFIGGTPLSKELKINFNYYNLHYIDNSKNIISNRIKSIFNVNQIQKRIKFAEKKVKHKLKNFDVAYIDYGNTAVLFYRLLIKEKVPFIVHFHGHDITSSLNNPLYRMELLSVFESANYIIAASNHIKRLLILEGCPEDKIVIIKYGIDGQRISVLSWNERRKKNPNIIFIGRLTPKKNPAALIRAFKIVNKKIPQSSLSVIGEGPLLNDCKQLASKLKLNDNIKFYGSLIREDIFQILNDHWIYAQHSVTSYQGDQEGFAISLAEAALHELPVVSTLHNGITENVIDGETGFLVQEYNYEAMAEKIIFLIENSEIAEKMGKAGRQHILKTCVPDERVNKICQLLKDSSDI